MTYLEKCRWLGRYQAAKQHESELRDKLLMLRSRASGCGKAFDGLPGGASDGQSLPRAVEHIVKAEHELEHQKRLCCVIRRRVETVIIRVPDEHDREILRRRYLVGQTFEHISDDMLLEYRWVRRRHKRCVNRLEF